MNRNILRQITDIQIQADKITATPPNSSEIIDFERYNEEIKTYLIQNVKDDFILSYVREIPCVPIEDLEGNTSLLASLMGLFSGGLGFNIQHMKKLERAKEAIAIIKGKYASIEFLLKNHFL
jgi:hypothetical protein